MIRPVLILLLVFAMAVAHSPPRSEANLIIDSWRLLTLVNSSEPFVPNDSDFFEDVTNPFQASHTATTQFSHAQVTYDLGWLLDEAHFDVSISHHLEQLDGRTTTSGRIFIRPEVDSMINVSADWQYDWPGAAIGLTTFSITVANTAIEETVARASANGGNVGVDPPFGSFSLSDSGILRAGESYELRYSASVYHFDPTPPGTFGEASGNIHFSITPIPEPATLALLALGAVMPTRRTRTLPQAADADQT